MSVPERTARILLVEDAIGITHALQRAMGLYQDGIYRVESCESVEAALKRLQEAPFDLLITDLRLPGMDGLELIRRARSFRPGIKMILITAFGSPEVEERARRLACEYLPKPFPLQDLFRLVDRVLGESAQLPAMPAPTAPLEGEQPDLDGYGLRIARMKNAHWIVLACDLDGTLAEDGQVAPETLEALRVARLSGLVLILVTGRTLDSLAADFPFHELCEAIVAENGAVIYFPRRDRVVLPFGQLDPVLLQRLEALDVPMERGIAIASAWLPHDEQILRLFRQARNGASIEYNREAMMVLPVGASKGNGLRVALHELGYSPHNVLACGDAENDLSLFEAVELGVAVSNAQPGLKAAADIVLPEPDGKGIAHLIGRLLESRSLSREARPGRNLLLGHRPNGIPVYIDPFLLVESSLGIFGSSGSGKSWLAGLLAEELLRHGYQICVIDSEGDYRSLGVSPHTLLLGGPGKPLPAVADVIEICEMNSTSLVLDLSTYNQGQRVVYVAELLDGLRNLRTRRGRPHCFFVDEIHSFCPAGGGVLTERFLEAIQWGGFVIVTYRMSQLSPLLLESLTHWLVTRMRLPEELNVLKTYIDSCQGANAVLEQLPTLPKGQAYFYSNPNAGGGEGIRFWAGPRLIPHIRHLHKYLRAPLPEGKRFYFQMSEDSSLGLSAANLWEFRELLSEVSAASLHYHLERGDFERWLGQVLHDEELAQRVHKVADRHPQGEELRRALLQVVVDRYEELEALI